MPNLRLKNPASRARAFTLVELLVVIGIILILVGILVPALAHVREEAKKMASKAQLDAIGKANEAYKVAFNAYGGFYSERDLSAGKNDFTSTENLVLSLIGRVANIDHGGDPQLPASLETDIGYPNLYLWEAKTGAGPQALAAVNYGPLQEFGAFYSPKATEIAKIQDGDDDQFPEFVDGSYGLPILYFRAQPGWERPAWDNTGKRGAFQIDCVQEYVQSAGLTNLANPKPASQASSLLNNANDEVANLAWLTINLKLSNLGAAQNQPNDDTADIPIGGFVLMASGRDRIYFDREQNGNADITAADQLKNFDDIIVAGGTAP